LGGAAVAVTPAKRGVHAEGGTGADTARTRHGCGLPGMTKKTQADTIALQGR
jgi:hypothetical protein